MKFLNKEFVKSFEWTDIPAFRYHSTEVLINGRKWIKTGKHTATTLIGNLYKLDVPSDEPNKYLLLIGVAKQHPDEISVTKSVGVELACARSYINPQIIMYLDEPIKQAQFNCICETYVNVQPVKFVKTPGELSTQNSCDCPCSSRQQMVDDVLTYAQEMYG